MEAELDAPAHLAEHLLESLLVPGRGVLQRRLVLEHGAETHGYELVRLVLERRPLPRKPVVDGDQLVETIPRGGVGVVIGERGGPQDARGDREREQPSLDREPRTA